MYNTYAVASIVAEPAREYSVDLLNRFCSCLHFTLFGYCGHLLHIAAAHDVDDAATFIRERMDLTCYTSMNLESFRCIGVDDDRPMSTFWKSVDISNDCGQSTISTISLKPCSIGVDNLKKISRLLPTLSAERRTQLDLQFSSIVTDILNGERIATITARPRAVHRGNRQDTDLTQKPLFPGRKVVNAGNNEQVRVNQVVQQLVPNPSRKRGRHKIESNMYSDATADVETSSLQANVFRSQKTLE
jgi:hypothetical protein